MNCTEAQRVLVGGILKVLADKRLSDTTLKVGGRLFPAHKLILSLSSRYFAVLFSGSFIESSQDIINLSEVGNDTMNPDDFELVLSLMYGKSIEITPKIARLCAYLQVVAFDRDQYIKNSRVPTQAIDVREFFETLDILYPEGIERNLLMKLNFGDKGHHYTKQPSMPDLSELDDDLIIEILSLKSYRVYNIIDFYNMITELIHKGHSPALLSLINYEILPLSLKNIIPDEHIQLMKGNIPVLQRDIITLMIGHIPGLQNFDVQQNFITLRKGEAFAFLLVSKIIKEMIDRIEVELMDGDHITKKFLLTEIQPIAFDMGDRAMPLMPKIRKVQVGDLIRGTYHSVNGSHVIVLH